MDDLDRAGSTGTAVGRISTEAKQCGVDESDEPSGSQLGWEAVHAFEEQHGIVLPEPYRTFVAEITNGESAGPPDYGLIELGELLSPVYDHGSLVLGTDGCGMYWHLIVTGSHRGHIWNITGEGASPFGAEFGNTTARSGFAGRVQHWTEDKDWFDADQEEQERS